MITRPGGTIRAGRLVLTNVNGEPLGRISRRGLLPHSARDFIDASAAPVGSVEGMPIPRSACTDAHGNGIGGLERIFLRSPIVGVGLGRLEGVQRPRDHLQTSDPASTGLMITFAPVASSLQRIMLIGVAVHFLS